jgi:hypothetical protein
MRAQSWVRPPPVHSDLLCLVDGTDKETHLNRKQLYVRKVDLDVTDHDETFVEHAIENVDETVGARRGY